jgi:hypothetical protein
MMTLCPCNDSLIVDVKLSSVRTAKIQIWRGDDPSELGHSFGRIYFLVQKARNLLVTGIRQSMVDNGLVPQLEEATYAYSEVPDGPYDGGIQGLESRDVATPTSGTTRSLWKTTTHSRASATRTTCHSLM